MCKDGYVFIGALGPFIYERVQKFLGLDPEEYSYDACSKDAAAVSSEKGLALDRKLREYCANRTRLEVEKEVNAVQIGCYRVMNAMDMLQEEHFSLRESHVPVLDRQSGVSIRVGGVIPKMSLTPGHDLERRPGYRRRHLGHHGETVLIFPACDSGILFGGNHPPDGTLYTAQPACDPLF